MQYDIYSEDPGTGKTVIYRSSAGSGKTFALAKSYLKLVLLDPSRYHQILAITFTNDAKDEMKNRIIGDLTSLANGEDSDIRKAIIQDFKEEGVERIEDVITLRAKTILNSILHDYSRFNISTIDHFFAQLIRHLAKELNLNLGYELDVDSNTALDTSIDMLFSQADKSTLNWLKDFALDRLDNDKGWDIRKNIAQLGKKLFHESYLDIEEALRNNINQLKEFINDQQKIIASFKKDVNTYSQQGVDIAQQYNLEASDFNRGVPYSNMLKMASPQYKFTNPPSKSFLEATTLDKWHTKSSQKVDIISAAHDAGMIDALMQLIDLYSGIRYQQFLESSAIMTYIHSYGVLSSLSAKLYQYRSNNNLVLISDTASILNKAIADIEMPFIYEKIGERYRYILIDEFQDTSRYQWKSLLPFFKNAVADGGQVFIVGDVKQSIYSWRGGDMKLLLNEAESDLDIQEPVIKTLDTNYRSCKNIVNFNSTFFQVAPEILPELIGLDHFQSDFNKAYEDVKQNIVKPCNGSIKIKFFNKSEEHNWKELALDETLKSINSILGDGYLLHDILILVRTNKDARLVAKMLIENNIQAISEEALMVNSSYKVKLVVSAMQFMTNHDDKLAIGEFNFFRNEIFRESRLELSEPDELLNETKQFSSLPLLDAIEELILHLGLNKQTDIYIQQFRDICLTRSMKGDTIQSFLKWWEEEKANEYSKEMAITLPDDQDAIEIKTIHKAKGLQSRIVILPLADFEMATRTNSTIWSNPTPETYNKWGSLPVAFSKNLLQTSFDSTYYNSYFQSSIEALNLLYVAFTRAIERLYVFTNGESKEPYSGGLIKSVLSNDSFGYRNLYDNKVEEFTLGDYKKRDKKQEKEDSAGPQTFSSTPLSNKISVDQKQSKLYLAYEGEKSEKVKEGLALHMAMAHIKDESSINKVLDQLETEQVISSEIKDKVATRIASLFNEIPQFKEWFSDKYEVLNERRIFSNGKTYIPDRVMIQGKKAIIIDYKREQKDPKHIKQINTYGSLLEELGYESIEKYLVYTNDLIIVDAS